MAKAYNGRRSGFDPFFEEVFSKGFSAAFFEDLPSRLESSFILGDVQVAEGAQVIGCKIDKGVTLIVEEGARVIGFVPCLLWQQ